MKIELTDHQLHLIMYCLQMQAHEFSWYERQDYRGILRAIESAANFEHDFGY